MVKPTNRHLHALITALGFAGIAFGVWARIYFFSRDCSLWLDEAYLARSICTRSLAELVATPLDLDQSAPVGFLYVVKLFTLLFGPTRQALRLWPLLCGIGCIAVFYLLLRCAVKVRHPEAFTAFFALQQVYIAYSSEFKPYMPDSFFVLLALLLGVLYEQKRVRLWPLCTAYAVILWFSFPATFFVAGHMVFLCVREVWRALFGRQHAQRPLWQLLRQLAPCAIVLFSFVLYYFFWLSGTKENVGDKSYWTNLAFPLIPNSLADLRLIKQMAGNILSMLPAGFVRYILYILVLADMIGMVVRRRLSPMPGLILAGGGTPNSIQHRILSHSEQTGAVRLDLPLSVGGTRGQPAV